LVRRLHIMVDRGRIEFNSNVLACFVAFLLDVSVRASLVLVTVWRGPNWLLILRSVRCTAL